MKVYVARQPIFDRNRNLYGYELLYRDSEQNFFNRSIDGSKATKAVISDVITTFGLDSLTNGKYAFINFTRELLLHRFPLLLDPEDFVVEILEDMQVDQELLDSLKELKDQGYTLAMDDYTGGSNYRDVFPFMDIVKVDFNLITHNDSVQIARYMRYSGKRLLAEKIETETAFMQAKANGYTLFQGYFFAKPTVLSRSTAEIISSTAMQIMRELAEKSPDFEVLADIIRRDISLSYKLLHRINTLEYYRSHRVKSIKHALVRMGLREVRRWVTLVLLRDSVGKGCDETVRTALVRGVFAEKLADELGSEVNSEEAFNTGMFSMIDAVIDESLPAILDEVCLTECVIAALLGEQNKYREILDLVIAYERGNWQAVSKKVKALRIDQGKVSDFYLESISYADLAFDGVRSQDISIIHEGKDCEPVDKGNSF